MQKVLAIAPHPDDETLGCGGTLLRHVDAGAEVYWLIVTDIHTENGYSNAAVAQRVAEIEKVQNAFGFSGTFNLSFPTTQLDTYPLTDLIGAIGSVVRETEADTMYIPHRGDAHSDHAIVFDAATACTKWFRYPSIRTVLCYETPSETDFGLGQTFVPSRYVDISDYLDRKVEIAELYPDELGNHPFPRSTEAIRNLARMRGAAAGCDAAESFMILKEIVR